MVYNNKIKPDFLLNFGFIYMINVYFDYKIGKNILTKIKIYNFLLHKIVFYAIIRYDDTVF